MTSRTVYTKTHKLRLDSRDGHFNVLVAYPENFTKTIVIVGGLVEHYSYMYGPVLEKAAAMGFRAIGVGIPYEKHLRGIDDASSLINDLLVVVDEIFDLKAHQLLLHSGAAIVIASDDFNPEDYHRVVLWSSMGLHHPSRHPANPFYAFTKFIAHSFRTLWSNLLDARGGLMSFGSHLAVLRNIFHMPGVFRVFYGRNLRSYLLRNPERYLIAHGKLDRVHPLDGADARWFKSKGVRFVNFKDEHWVHTVIYMNDAVLQIEDILNTK